MYQLWSYLSWSELIGLYCLIAIVVTALHFTPILSDDSE